MKNKKNYKENQEISIFTNFLKIEKGIIEKIENETIYIKPKNESFCNSLKDKQKVFVR